MIIETGLDGWVGGRMGEEERTRMASRYFLCSCFSSISLKFYFKSYNCHNCSKIHLYVPIVVTLYASHPSVELPHLSLDPADYDYIQCLKNSLILFFLTFFCCLA